MQLWLVFGQSSFLYRNKWIEIRHKIIMSRYFLRHYFINPQRYENHYRQTDTKLNYSYIQSHSLESSETHEGKKTKTSTDSRSSTSVRSGHRGGGNRDSAVSGEVDGRDRAGSSNRSNRSSLGGGRSHGHARGRSHHGCARGSNRGSDVRASGRGGASKVGADLGSGSGGLLLVLGRARLLGASSDGGDEALAGAEARNISGLAASGGNGGQGAVNLLDMFSDLKRAEREVRELTAQLGRRDAREAAS